MEESEEAPGQRAPRSKRCPADVRHRNEEASADMVEEPAARPALAKLLSINFPAEMFCAAALDVRKCVITHCSALMEELDIFRNYKGNHERREKKKRKID